MATISPRALKQGSSAGHNIPAPLSSMVGRTRELEGISDTLRRTRLVTLTGPGGVGKTRLALELARRQIARRPDGVWLVDLTAGPATPDVAAETARTLGVRGPRGIRPAETLGRFLADRDVLLVLDNCEHVVDACAELATALLSSCADVRILATSRESLGVSGETVWTLEALDAEDAYRLFLERARQRRPEFIPSAQADATIVRLCERLDRLPLAIELAAARISAMTPAEILADLEPRLGALGGGGRLSPSRHRTVRATVEWSHQLLDRNEEAAFRALAVFLGGFDAEAATSVAPALTLDVLARLVDKSLVAVSETAQRKTRYRLLETVREYARELLAEAGELEVVQERHFQHFSAVATLERESWPSLAAVGGSHGAQPMVAELQDDYENVRAALEWSAAADPCAGMTLFARTWELFQMFGQADGVRLGELLLERCPAQDRTRVLVLISVGGLRMMQADMEGVREIQEHARTLSRRLGEHALEGWARLFQGLAPTLAGAVDPGRDALTEARDLLREAGVPNGEGKAIAALGLIELITGEPERAKQLVQEALSIQVDAGDLWSQGQCHTYLGMIAEANSDLSGATAHYRQAIESLRPFHDAALLPGALAFQGGVIARRDPKRALKVVAAAWAMRARAGGEFPPVFRERVERARAVSEAALGADADLIAAEGARLHPDEAIALAFGAATARPTHPSGLSRRELEVVRLVASGLTNKAIAADLHLSVRTVESHVRNVLAKVGLENRTQLATWARERIQ
jgi:predicted ATPase/DNA-binding CsgD family transcriptional regulator